MDRPPDVPELLRKYHALLLEMHANRIEAGGRPRTLNRLTDRLQTLQLTLRDTPEGRAGITDFAVTDTCPTVRGWAAAHALFWDEERARPVLEEESAGKGLHAFDAEMVLREFDAGRLTMTWVPGKR